MFKLAFLTDPHLAPLPEPTVRELLSKRLFGYINWRLNRKAFHVREVLDAITRDMLSHKPDHIAVGGDLVNLALPDEFVRAVDWLHTLGLPEQVSLTPGNHDAYVRTNPHAGLELWRAYMTSDVRQAKKLAPSDNGFPWVRRFGKVALIGLSSAVATPPFFASGRLGQAQINALVRILKELRASDHFRVVMVHHPPLMAMSSKRRGLSDVSDLHAVLEEQGAELVLFGHRHFHSLSYLSTNSGADVPVLGGPSASAAHGAQEELARYYLLHIGKKGNSWRCDMVSRGMKAPESPIVEIDRKSLTG